ATRDDALADRQARHRHAEVRRGKTEQRLRRIGGRTAHPWPDAANRGTRRLRRRLRSQVGIRRDELQLVDSHAQLFSRNLQHPGQRPLAYLGLAAHDRSGVIGVDDDPRVNARLIERAVARKRALRPRSVAGKPTEAEPDDQSPTALQEALPGELLLVQEPRHHLPPFAITAAACLIAVRIRGYVPHRHRWPFIAVRIWSSVGFFVVDSRSAAWIIIPFWQ